MNLGPKTITIEVEYQYDVTKIRAKSSDTLWVVKNKICKKLGVDVHLQVWLYDGRDIGKSSEVSVCKGWMTSQKVQKPLVLKQLWDKLQVWQITLETTLKLPKVPNLKKIPWEAKKVVYALFDQQEVVSKLTSEASILEDSTDISKMVLSAKGGDFKKVFDILERKPHLINAIPAERAWSVLHQAVYHDNYEAVEVLLAMSSCDPEIKAKKDAAGIGEAGITPLRLAEKMQHIGCKDLLDEHTKTNTTGTMVTFVSTETGEKMLEDGIPYYHMAASFLRPKVLQTLHLDGESFLYVSHKMYGLLNEEWQYVRDVVKDTLYPFDTCAAEHIGAVSSASELKSALIWVYTGSTVYGQANAALRRASDAEFPHGDDLLVSLYSLFLGSVLFDWEELRRVTDTTYRCLVLSKEQADMYKQGTSFYWLSFTSSSTKKESSFPFNRTDSNESFPAVFIINNSNDSMWSPRDITPYSQCPGEYEAVFPSGAKFTVKDVKSHDGHTDYYIDLAEI